MELQRHLAEFRSRGISLLGVSTEPLAAAGRAARDLHLAFPLLADRDHRLSLAFGVFAVNAVEAEDTDTLVALDGAGGVIWRRPTNEITVPATVALAAFQHPA